MLFNSASGTIYIQPELALRRGMTRAEILSMPLAWEEWIVIEGVSYGFRAESISKRMSGWSKAQYDNTKLWGSGGFMETREDKSGKLTDNLKRCD